MISTNHSGSRSACGQGRLVAGLVENQGGAAERKSPALGRAWIGSRLRLIPSSLKAQGAHHAEHVTTLRPEGLTYIGNLSVLALS